MNQVNHRSFQTGKAKIKGAAIHMWVWKTVGMHIAALCRAVKIQPARIRQAHRARRFIERLPRRIISRAAHDGKTGVVEHFYQMAVPAGDDET